MRPKLDAGKSPTRHGGSASSSVLITLPLRSLSATRAPGFDTSRFDQPIDREDLVRIGGRGLLLIRTFMDEVVFNAAGNSITMVKRFQTLLRPVPGCCAGGAFLDGADRDQPAEALS
ncbi:MAG: ATP-binding protein [Isosphaeraceae bacterium]